MTRRWTPDQSFAAVRRVPFRFPEAGSAKPADARWRRRHRPMNDASNELDSLLPQVDQVVGRLQNWQTGTTPARRRSAPRNFAGAERRPTFGDSFDGEPFLKAVAGWRRGDAEANQYVKSILGTSACDRPGDHPEQLRRADLGTALAAAEHLPRPHERRARCHRRGGRCPVRGNRPSRPRSSRARTAPTRTTATTASRVAAATL